MFGHYKSVLEICLPHFIPCSVGTTEQITFFYYYYYYYYNNNLNLECEKIESLGNLTYI